MENDNPFTRLSAWIKNNHWAAFYRIAGTAFGVAGIIVIFWRPTSNAQYTTTAGIAVFAVLYVIAQAVERIVEWVTDLLKLFPKSSGAEKATVTRELRVIDRTMNRTLVDDMAMRAAIDGSSAAEALRAAADDAVTAAANPRRKPRWTTSGPMCCSSRTACRSCWLRSRSTG